MTPGRIGLAALTLLIAGGALRAQDAPPDAAGTYANPLPVVAPGLGPVESCADPDAIQGSAGDPYWYLYCTSDPLTAAERDEGGELVFHLLPTFRSRDLVRWEHAGDALDRDPATPAPPPPAWVDPASFIWAPEIEAIGDRHYLLFSITDVTDEVSGEPGCQGDNAIGYAEAPGPLGPWEPAAEPLIAPRRFEAGCEFFWTIDPEVIRAEDGRHLIYYGSFHGGIEARELIVAADGSLSAPAETAVPVAIPNRYEGAEVVWRDGWYYLFASATACCAGPQTGYAVFVGRSKGPTGPFLDREGVSFLDAGVGGTPVIAQNGNRWIGAGHNTVLEDMAGQWWTLYHAVDEADPYFAGETGFTKRPVLLDRLDWVDGWPVLNGGAGPSDGPRPAPALAPGEAAAAPPPTLGDAPASGAAIWADRFDGPALDPRWSWLRGPAEHAVAQGRLGMPTRDADLYEDRDDAPILVTEAPGGDYAVEARVRTDLPPEGCCHNYVQAGLVIHGDDDNYVKLVVASIWETRQTEFARELGPMAPGFPRYGNTVVGPPGPDWTHLRIEVRRRDDGEHYTAWTSRDGGAWVRGGTWTHDLGPEARIGLVAMSGAGFRAEFDEVRVLALPE